MRVRQGWMVAALLGLLVFGSVASAQSIQTIGPIDPVNGFPMWLEDGNGLALGVCNDEGGFCAFARPDPLAPLAFPGNYPNEIFYYMLVATTPAPDGSAFAMEYAFEGAFALEEVVDGDQVAFGRLRVRSTGMQPNATYTITTPYETIEMTADGLGEINETLDRGFGGAPFTGLLNAGIGPFLGWDPAVPPAAPAGYLGDFATEHPIAGSPTGNNFLRIEGPNVGLLGAANLCDDPALGPDPTATTDCIQQPNFIVSGKIATQLGVEVERATYTKTAAGTVVSVWATSASNEDLRATVDGTTEFALTNEPGTGNYFARFPISNTQVVPQTITVRNYSDLPITTKTAPLKDLVRITQATFDEASGTLVVRGTSSDSVGAQSLSIGFGAANAGGGTLDATGTLTVTGLAVPPSKISMESTAGGRTEADVVVTGISAQLLADAGADQTGAPGQTLTLDGSGSTGAISFQWAVVSTLPAGAVVTIDNASAAIASITLPADPVQATIELTVSDGLGGTSSDLVVVTNVTGDLPPTVDAGADLTVGAGDIVTLQGIATGIYDSVLWTQVAGPTVTLSDPTILNPTFTMPTGQNVLTFTLTATGPFGSASASVNIDTPAGTIPTITVIQAAYRSSKDQWRVTGLSSVPGPGHTVTVYLGAGTTGTVLGSAVVDNLGNWEFRERNHPIAAQPGDVITITTSLGGLLQGVPVTVN